MLHNIILIIFSRLKLCLHKITTMYKYFFAKIINKKFSNCFINTKQHINWIHAEDQCQWNMFACIWKMSLFYNNNEKSTIMSITTYSDTWSPNLVIKDQYLNAKITFSSTDYVSPKPIALV